MHINQFKLVSKVGSVGTLLFMASAVSAQTFSAVADTFTSYNSQSTNYGSNINLNIESDGTADTKDRVTYIRFDFSSYTGGSISGATFTMYPFEQISGTPQNFSFYGVSDGGADENFNESTLTWSNSGYGYESGENITDSTNFSDLVYVGDLTGVEDSDEGGSVSFSSADLDTFLNEDANNIVTFIVVNTNGTGSYNKFYSKDYSDGSSAPSLAIPEPASGTLALGLGIFAAVSLVRRRRT